MKTFEECVEEFPTNCEMCGWATYEKLISEVADAKLGDLIFYNYMYLCLNCYTIEISGTSEI